MFFSQVLILKLVLGSVRVCPSLGINLERLALVLSSGMRLLLLVSFSKPVRIPHLPLKLLVFEIALVLLLEIVHFLDQ